MTSPDPVFELIKTLGSFAGWVSAGFLFFDRLIKGRPILTIVTEAPPPSELERDIALRVINTSDAPIWIQSLGFHPAVYWPALSDSTAAVVAAALQRRVTEVIEPRGERTFPLVRQGEDFRKASESTFTVTLAWRRLNRPKWPQLPVRLRSSVPLVEALRRAGIIRAQTDEP